MNDNPLISIVISVYNRLDSLAKCLESIRAQEYKNYEIIVIDDGSTADLDSIKGMCDTYIRNKINLGCAYSRNIGVLKSRGDILLFLDSDAVVLADSLRKLPEIFQSDPAIGAVGGSGPPDESGKDVKYIVGRSYNNLGHVRGTRYYPSKQKFSPQLYDCHHLESAFLAIRRDVLGQVGGFDPYFRYMGEDRDICLRIKIDLGYRVIASLATRAIHYAVPSDNPDKNPKTYGRFFLSKFLQVAIKRNGLWGGICWMVANIKHELDYRYFFGAIRQLMDHKQFIKRRNRDYLKQSELDDYCALRMGEYLKSHLPFPVKIPLPTPESIIFFLTSRCNALCEHCFIPVNSRAIEGEMCLKDMTRIIDRLKKPATICLTGGEPFLREDLGVIVDEFLRAPMVQHIDLLTNGSFPEKIETLCRKVCQQHNKTFGVQLSLDGLSETHDAIRKLPHSFDKTLETCARLKCLREEYCRFSFIVHITIMKQNILQLKQLVEFLEERGYPSKLSIVRGNAFGTFGVPSDILNPDYNPVGDVSVEPEEVRKLLQRISKKYPKYFSPFQKRKLDIMLDTLNFKKRQVPCLAGYTQAVVYSNGGIGICEQVRPFGNLSRWDLDLEKAWNSKEAMEHRMKLLSCGCVHGCGIGASIGIQNPRMNPLGKWLK